MTLWELSILDVIQQHLRCLPMDRLMVIVTTLGNGGAVWLLTGAALLFPRRTRRLGICLLAAVAVMAAVCSVGLKPLVARPRPCDLNPAVQLLIDRPTDFSFPSGHTAASFAAVTVLALGQCRYRKAAAVLAVLIAFSRLYLYVHFPTDVLGGALLGTLLGWCCFTAVRFAFRRCTLDERRKRECS